MHFSLRNGSDLVIRAKRKLVTGDSDILELIPQAKLQGDLPSVLIEGYAHWLNLSTSVIEIRSLDSLWVTSPENWEIHCTPGHYRMQKGDELLVDMRSQSWKMVSSLLTPFDTPQNLIVSLSPVDSGRPTSSSQLSVMLPRYGLSFYVDEDGDLQSHNMRGMVYDENQSIGTLFGLENRLVLRPKIRDIELTHRCVLIPDGEISFEKSGRHVRVKVDTHRPSLQGRITYQTYKVDTELGCLAGNASLANKLYCVYLHALTSGCGTDPLTGRLGTEEALSLLRSASCWSIIKFGSREADLLSSIASICPSRTWYPKHLKCMQKVEWLNLPASAQHHGLYIVSKAIKEHYESVQLFHESGSGPLFHRFPWRDDHLLERSARRAAYLFPSEFSGQLSGENIDVQYSARDLVEIASGEQRAYTAAAAVHHRTASAMTTKNLVSMVESWTGCLSGDATLSLKYDTSWLNPDLPSIWLTLYKLLRRRDDEKWFQMLFSLPAMAYALSPLSDLVPVFVAFASDPRFRLEDAPQYASYDIAERYAPSPGTLRNYVSNCARPFERSPESDEPARTGESLKNLRKRQVQMYKTRCDSHASATVQQSVNAWPSEILPRCSLNPNLYNVSDLTSRFKRHFSSCYRNLKLKEHLTRVQNILDDVYSQASPIPTLQYSFQPSQSIPSRAFWPITMDQLFARPAPLLQEHDRLSPHSVDDRNTSFSGSASLHQLIATVDANAVNTFQHQYASALRTSAESFASEISLAAHGATELPTAEILEAHYTLCKKNYIDGRDCVEQHLSPRGYSEQALEESGQWPRITPHALFRSLASNSPIVLSDDWKKCLIRLTLLALELQRARRLLRLHVDSLREELRRELQNDGCDGWNAEEHPDWLLIQVGVSCDLSI